MKCYDVIKADKDARKATIIISDFHNWDDKKLCNIQITDTAFIVNNKQMKLVKDHNNCIANIQKTQIKSRDFNELFEMIIDDFWYSYSKRWISYVLEHGKEITAA